MLFRGYFDSVTDVRATDRIIDSITIRSFFQIHRWGNLPKRSTIHDNIQAVSYETRTYIFRSQLADVRDQGIDMKDEVSYRQRERKEDLSLSGKSEQDAKK